MYRQIAKELTLTEKIKGSKFIGHSFPVSGREEARTIIARLEDEYRKASHVCWAFRVDENGQTLGYSSDAGEPHSSAGPPILASLEGRALVNTLCIVVRYFGGTKLGIGGLIRAYGGVAGKTLDEAGFTEFHPQFNLHLRVPLQHYSDLMRILRKHKIEFTQQSNECIAEFTFPVDEKDRASIRADLTLIEGIEFLD